MPDDYDPLAGTASKAAGNRALDGLAKLSAMLSAPECDGWRDYGFTCRVATRAFRVLPCGDGPNKLLDPETKALVPRVEGAADLVEALLKETKRFTERRQPTWLGRLRKTLRRALTTHNSKGRPAAMSAFSFAQARRPTRD